MRNYWTIALLLFVMEAFATSNAGIAFPQELVDMVCSGKTNHRTLLLDAVTEYRGENHSIMSPRQFSIPEIFAFADLIVGPGADTVLIDTNHVQNGNVYVLGNGVFIVDNARFSVVGQIGAMGNGKIYVRNGATLHFNQSWVGQYSLWLFENSYFEAADATIDANHVMHFVETHDDATYIARRCYYPDWTFKKFFERSTVIMEDVAHIGDMMVGDSSNIHLIRCDTLMPWFQAPDGSIIDIEFPDPDSVEHFEFHSGVAGIDGVGETFILDTCARCWWSFETYPGCSVIVRNSEIRGCAQRIPGADTFSISGIRNYNFNTNLVVPLSDRYLQFISTYNFWWNWYPWENTVFFIDSCVFGEMICSNTATIFATRCIHDGSTITLATKDSSFMSFEAGTSYAFAGSFQQSTLLMKDTYITPLWPYQATNIAHHNSRFLCVNCDFDSLPFALDTALVMWVAIESPESAGVECVVPIIGSAWIDVGPENPATFERYRLYWSPADSAVWTLIDDSTGEVSNGILGLWNTSSLGEGDYELRLVLINSEGDSLTAFKDISITSVGIAEGRLPEDIAISAYPNPFNSAVTISLRQAGTPDLPADDLSPVGQASVPVIEIFDINGRMVEEIPVIGSESAKPLSTNASGACRWTPAPSVGSGVYLVRAKIGDESTTKKLVYLR